MCLVISRASSKNSLGLHAGEGGMPGPFPNTGSAWSCQLCWNYSQSTPGVCSSSPNVQQVVTDKQFLKVLYTGCICTLFYNSRLGVVVVHVSCDQWVGHKLWNKLSSSGLSGWERKPQSLLQLLMWDHISHSSVLSLFRHLLIVVRAGCMAAVLGKAHWFGCQYSSYGTERIHGGCHHLILTAILSVTGWILAQFVSAAWGSQA